MNFYKSFYDPVTHPTKYRPSRVCQLAWVLLDSSLNQVEAHSYLVKAVGWRMSEQATKVNGITDSILEEKGQDFSTVMNHFLYTIEKYRPKFFVGFRVRFDLYVLVADAVLRGQHYVAQALDGYRYRLLDVAQAAYQIDKMPHKGTRLEVVCEKLGVEHLEKHTALGDTKATAECFRRYMRRCEGDVNMFKKKIMWRKRKTPEKSTVEEVKKIVGIDMK
eukprot:TRINITY_DN1382_c0_g2_i3.p2 TRINITY_DN1382_c0_g2~~TRINITY_DN1382_c0_g2_i3.p2  ORF type:complete len:219 (-),score=29.49 TRINITY_DN1382_c0_g2_i3:103-759(-)